MARTILDCLNEAQPPSLDAQCEDISKGFRHYLVKNLFRAILSENINISYKLSNDLESDQ